MIAFPTGASLDETGKIQVGSNASMVGEAAPTVRMLLDEETLARAMAGEDVLFAYAVDWIEAQNQIPELSGASTQRAAAPGWAVVLGAFAILAVCTVGGEGVGKGSRYRYLGSGSDTGFCDHISVLNCAISGSREYR